MGDFNSNEENKNKVGQIIFIILLLAAFIFIFFNLSKTTITNYVDIPYSEFLSYLENNQIKEVEIRGNWIFCISKTSNYRYKTYIPYVDPDLLNRIRSSGVEVIKGSEVKDSSGFWYTIFLIGSSIIFLILIFNMFNRQIRGANNQAFNFARARARKITNTNVTFNDVAGVEEAKQELVEVVEYLKKPQKFQALGAKIPRGILLVGPPGCGKTLLAKAVAGEAGVPFFSISGSDFVEMFVGVGAARVRDLFMQAKSNAPSIIFIDELDAVGRSRGAGLGGGHDEREQTLNQLLVEMDGFESTDSVIVLAATNRPDILDNALLRPGRFDRRVVVDRPDVKGRYEILKIHTKKVPLDKDVDLWELARATIGMSGADLANIVNEAAILAARKNLSKINNEVIQEARDKVFLGPERKSLVIGYKEKKITAYHEAGHALMHLLLKNLDPLHKVTIVPRGMALGITWNLPVDDRHHYSRSFYIDTICSFLGGRVAEELIFNETFTGAENDLERATKIAHDMVCKWGMSSLGPIQFGESKEDVFLGKDLIKEKNYSDNTAKLIDEEIKKIVTQCYEKTKKLIIENKDKLDKIANSLLEKESLTADQIYELVGLEKPSFKSDEDFYNGKLIDDDGKKNIIVEYEGIEKNAKQKEKENKRKKSSKKSVKKEEKK
ncbi:MAG: ATP-dependent zinc metalloprotease FtsH [Spirochaetes bacterium]|nr:ATP-dependent zinc metalloprotease FtsH [Spirochaetota bacterium]